MARLKIEVRKLAMGPATSRSTAAAPAQTQPRIPQQPSQQMPLVGSVAAGIIDLTAEGEDSDDSDEPLGGVVPASVASSVPIGGLAAGSQDVESDVDEEWPVQAPTQEASVVAAESSASVANEGAESTISSLSIVADGDCAINSDQDDEEEDEELPIQVAQEREVSSESVRTTELSDIEDIGPIEKDQQEQRVAVGDEKTASSDENTLIVAAQPNASADAADGEHLEDGEIFEEGAMSTSPEKVKETIAQELQAMRDAAGESEALRPKKHKKRGKKKAKRKLDAMMMPQAGPDFDRSVRHQPFMLRNPHDPRVVFLGPGAMFGDLSRPQPPLPNANGGLPFAPPPMFANDQIMRVNRHGGVKMFNSRTEFQSGDIPTTSLGPSRFNYVIVPRPPARIDPTKAMLGPPSSGTPKPPSSVSTESIHSQDEDEPMMNLDDLRAAALRTKKTEKTLSQSAESTVATNSPADSSINVTQADSLSQEEEPDIDQLRAAILKSMKRRPKKSSTETATSVADKGSQDDSVSLSSNTATQAKDDPAVIVTKTTELPQIPPLSSDSQEPMSVSGSGSLSGSDSVAGSSRAESPAAGATPAPTVSIGTMTPEFRPLTAASQLLVIRLSPEDYVKTTSVSDPPVPKANGSNIGAAIEEMKRKIAEREKQLQSNNNRVAPAGKPVHSAPCSPGKVTKCIPENDPTKEVCIETDGGDEACNQFNAQSLSSAAANDSVSSESIQRDNSVQNGAQDPVIPEETTTIETHVTHEANVEVLDVSSQLTDAETIVVNASEGVDEVHEDTATNPTEYMSVLSSLKTFVQQLKTCEAECEKADQEVKRLDNEIAKVRQQILVAEAATQAP